MVTLIENFGRKDELFKKNRSYSTAEKLVDSYEMFFNCYTIHDRIVPEAFVEGFLEESGVDVNKNLLDSVMDVLSELSVVGRNRAWIIRKLQGLIFFNDFDF